MTFSLAYRFFTEELNIPVSSKYQQAFTIEQLDKQFPGFAKVATETGVTETYFLGAVQDQSWLKTNQASLYDITPSVSEELSKSKDADYPALYVFAMVIAEEASPSRTQLAKMVRFFNRASKGAPVIALFIHRDIFHIAGVERTHYVKTGLVGEKVGKVSLLRDVAQDLSKRHRGHIDILNELAEKAKSVKSFRELYNAWTEVFNISTLNKKFYAELSNWYFWALKHVEFPNGFENGQKWENDASDIDKKECNAQALIRFITRIIFIWFLKEKGLVNKNLFDRDKIKNILNEGLLADEQSAYYRAVLQNLFFCVLNTERNADSSKPLRFFTDSKNTQHMVHTRMRYRKLIQNENELINWWEDTPFLNGGLFECLDYEIKESNSTRRRFDSFSDNPINENQLRFPNLLFWSPETKTDLSAFFGEDSQKSKKEIKHANVSVRGIFNILNRYKFTIEENTPLEQEIALDPELLGRIFENLLASYNPETEETARKSTGSFYTPREIVEYMVDESLIAYLQQNVPAISDENTFRLLLTDSEEKPNLSPKQCLQIIDPACGSGAFPMGILHKLVVILRKADPQNLNWKQAQINALESISDDDLKFQLLSDIEKAFDAQHNYGDYGRKLYLIQNCVFGVDKQAIAVQISKLRFFISLLVDQKVVPHEKNFGLRPLPNLETKFVAADSLIGIHKGGQADFSTPKVIELKKELSKARKDYFTIRNRDQKNKNRDHQADLRKNIIQEISRTGFDSELTLKLAEWNPFDQNASASFFDRVCLCGINTGFDFFMGNPPYVQIQKFSGKDEQNDWLNQKYQTYNRMGDIYCLFYEKGWQILRQQGILAFITSNKWMRAGYGESIRNFFATHTNPLLLIDFGGLQVFESATVDTNILIFRKEENRNQTRACTFAKDFDLTTGLAAYVKAKAYTKAGFTAESWIIGTETQDRIKQKIEAKGTPLKDWDIQINFGIKTGLNEAFIIDTATKERLCAEDPRSAEILKPILRGKDIKKWKAQWAGLWLLYIPWHFPLQNDPSIKGSSEIAEEAFSKQYPAVYNHLSSFKNELSNRNKSETGIRYEWYALQRWGADYWQEFEKPKIIWKRIGSVIRFSYSEEIEMCLDSTCIAMGEKLKYLTTILNSEMVYYQLANSSPRTGVGDMIISVQALEPLLVIKPDPVTENIFISYFDRILSLKQTNPDADISALEAEVDARVFRLYELTVEEVEVVLAASPASEDQKERIRENYHLL